MTGYFARGLGVLLGFSGICSGTTALADPATITAATAIQSGSTWTI